VDNPAAYPARFFPLTGARVKTTAIERGNDTFLSHYFIRADSGKPILAFSSTAPKILN